MSLINNKCQMVLLLLMLCLCHAQRRESYKTFVAQPTGSGATLSTGIADWPFVKSLKLAKQQRSQPNSDETEEIFAPRPTSGQLRTRETTARDELMDAQTGSGLPASEQMPAETSTTTSTTTTTTTTTEMASSTTEAPSSSVSPLLMSQFHQSMQRAVEGIVKQAAQAGPGAKPLARAPSSSSLSLNVLLKNFGVHNLTNLDRILLRSTLNKPSVALNETGDSQQLSIVGKLDQGVPTGSGPQSDASVRDARDPSVAECRIQYTNKQVNISLANGASGDYGCDYIIDRSLPTNYSSPAGRLLSGSVCKLKLRSKFFEADPSELQTCPGSYLSVDGRQFCALLIEQAKHLDRMFEFPFERQLFDLRMVHKPEEAAPSADQEPAAEIYIELEPIQDASCRQEPVTAKPATSQTDAPSTTTEPPREAAIEPDMSVDSRALPAADRRLILKLPAAERLPLPVTINNRIKISQSFDTSPMRLPSSGHAHHAKPTPGPERTVIRISGIDRASGARKLPVDEQQDDLGDNSDDDLCDGLVHSSVQGSLQTPDYPHYYPMNTSCRFVVRRQSDLYCQLTLHFRDFDLVSAGEQSCQSDYLQIGDTRYCNRYAMIGHKMRLDFRSGKPDSEGRPQFELLFRSDHLQSGRGLLVKYHQGLCSEQQAPATAQPAAQLTLAPPVHEPDFRLVARTATPTSRPTTTEATRRRTPAGSTTTTTTTARPTTGGLMSSMASSMSSMLLPALEQPTANETYGDCSEYHGATSFLLTSPGFGRQDSYPNSQQCAYYVRRNSTKVCYLELTFLQFDLEADASCRYDYLEINGVRLCGSIRDSGHKTSRIYLFDEPLKVLKFVADDSSSRSGFLIRAEQLQCGSSGDIRRQPKTLDFSSPQSSQNENQARTIEYDAPQETPTPSNQTAASGLSVCDELLFGREFTIRSPRWPEAYDQEPVPSQCRYTIVRDASQSSGNQRICQLELRFAHLTLGPNDCLDIHGHELLCGFHSRNLIKYYPFDKSSHLTITLYTAGTGKLARQASALHSDLLPTRGPLRYMIVGRQHECIDDFLAPQAELASSFYNGTNLLYATDGESRNATDSKSTRQQGQAERSSDSRIRYDFSSTTPARLGSDRRVSSLHPTSGNKLSYLAVDQNQSSASLRQSNGSRPRASGHSHHKSSGSTLVSWRQGASLAAGGNCQELGHLERRGNQIYSPSFPFGKLIEQEVHCFMVITSQFPVSSGCPELELDFLDLDFGKTVGKPCESDYIQVQGGERLCSLEQIEAKLGSSRRLVVPFERSAELPNQHKPIVLLLHREPTSGEPTRGFLVRQKQTLNKCHSRDPAIEPAARPAMTSRRPSESARGCLIQLNQYNGILSSTNIMPRLRASAAAQGKLFDECEIRFRLLAGHCKLQLTFTEEFELAPRLDGRCIEWLEWPDGGQFCAKDLRNSSLLLSPSQDGDQTVSLKFLSSTTSSSQMVAIFRQLECRAEPLPLQRASGSSRSADQTRQDAASQRSPSVEFREINLRSEFFELDSGKLAAGKSYAPNMFIVYRIKRHSPEVCKLRLLIQRFQLEPSVGCKNDFLDVNNVDRLCGELLAPEEMQREYRWPQSDGRDFVLSFVTDATQQRAGYLIYGQQLTANCSMPAVAKTQQQTTTFDELAEQQPAKQEPAQESCVKVIDKPEFQLASPRWPQRYPQNSSCRYLIRRASSDICSLKLNILSLSLGAEELDNCQQARDKLQIAGHQLCGLQTKPRSLEIDFAGQPFISGLFNGSSGDGFGFYVEAKQVDCGSVHEQEAVELPPSELAKESQWHESQGCNQLVTDDGATIESEGFPMLPHRHNQNCLYALRRPNKSVCAVDLVLNHFELDEGSLNRTRCDTDYLEIDYGRLCGSYPPRHRLRYSYFRDELDKYIRFRSDASLARAGFSISVNQVTDCRPLEPSAGKTARDEQNSDELISYLPTNSISNSTSDKPEVGDQLPARQQGTLCQFVYSNQRQFVVSPNYNEHRHHYDNNLDCLYKIRATGYDVCSLRLTFVDLELEQSSDCHKDYLLVDNRRYCGQQKGKQQLELPFPDALPREIHLLLHTDGQTNQGKGLKLLYEQLKCSHSSPAALGDQHFRYINGQEGDELEGGSWNQRTGRGMQLNRRRPVEQLSYPANYVSEQPQGSSGHIATHKLGAGGKIRGSHEAQSQRVEEQETRLIELEKPIVVVQSKGPARVVGQRGSS